MLKGKGRKPRSKQDVDPGRGPPIKRRGACYQDSPRLRTDPCNIKTNEYGKEKKWHRPALTKNPP